jgi:hypothetical protein
LKETPSHIYRVGTVGEGGFFMFNLNDPVIWVMVTMLEFVGAFSLVVILFQLIVQTKNRS